MKKQKSTFRLSLCNSYILFETRITDALIPGDDFRQFRKKISFSVFLVNIFVGVISLVNSSVHDLRPFLDFGPFAMFRLGRFIEPELDVGYQLNCTFVELNGLVQTTALFVFYSLQEQILCLKIRNSFWFYSTRRIFFSPLILFNKLNFLTKTRICTKAIFYKTIFHAPIAF